MTHECTRRVLASLAVAAAAWFAPAATAAPCAGFTDIDDSSPFCTGVEWIKNQGITVGCGTGSTYCPEAPVSRLGMATFLKRFADAGTGVPYAYTNTPTCPFTNQCVVVFPPVPTGKRLLLTNVRVFLSGTTANAMLVLNRNATGFPLMAFPLAPFGGAYYGTLLSANVAVDLAFETGESPVVEVGVSAGAGGIASSGFNKFGVTGYLVNAL